MLFLSFDFLFSVLFLYIGGDVGEISVQEDRFKGSLCIAPEAAGITDDFNIFQWAFKL